MIKPTKGDFDRAVANNWSATTCLVAQLMIRQGIQPSQLDPRRNPLEFAKLNDLKELMGDFDKAFDCGETGKIDKPALAKIRAALPRFNWPWQRLRKPAC